MGRVIYELHKRLLARSIEAEAALRLERDVAAALANLCLHRGPKPREANRGEIAQQAHDVSEVIFRSSVRHARLTGSCA